MSPQKTKIKKSDFGEKWPFIPETAEFYADKSLCFTIKFDKEEFALNGVALNQGYENLNSTVWADNPGIPGTKKTLTPIIKYALKLKI